jgi:hypothetical protein
VEGKEKTEVEEGNRKRDCWLSGLIEVEGHVTPDAARTLQAPGTAGSKDFKLFREKPRDLRVKRFVGSQDCVSAGSQDCSLIHAKHRDLCIKSS